MYQESVRYGDWLAFVRNDVEMEAPRNPKLIYKKVLPGSLAGLA